MASSTVAPFGHGSIENIARIIGELYTGPEVTRMLASLGMPDTLGASATKCVNGQLKLPVGGRENCL